MMCKRAAGSTWGFKPDTIKWIYRSLIRPLLLYAATIWVNAVFTDKNLGQLRIVWRLSHLMTTGALPSTSLVTLDKITDTTPVDVKIRGEAIRGNNAYCEWNIG